MHPNEHEQQMLDQQSGAAMDRRAKPQVAHTPGPWDFCKPHHRWMVYPTSALDGGIDYFVANAIETEHGEAVAKANARLIATAPEMLAALQNVQKLISEAAMTGFNCHDGDWAERLFASQQLTSKAIWKATGTGPRPLSEADTRA